MLNISFSQAIAARVSWHTGESLVGQTVKRECIINCLSFYAFNSTLVKASEVLNNEKNVFSSINVYKHKIIKFLL